MAKTCASIIYPGLTYDQIDAHWDDPKFWDGSRPSIVNSGVKIYPGWPSSSNLDDDLANNISHVTVFTQVTERNTTRYPEREHVTVPAAAPTLTLTISGPSLRPTNPLFDTPGISYDAGGDYDQPIEVELFTIVIGGSVAVPQNIALRINSKFYTYGVQATDSLVGIASTLAAEVAADIPGTMASGTSLILGPTARLQAARLGTVGTISKEVRRQERVVQISVWSNAPDVRDIIAAAIDVELAERRFITMPDGFGARLIYKNSMVIDSLQKATLYRRDLNYTVEYATTVSKSRAQVIAPSINFNEDIVITF
jgi:hypothetical protein